MKKFTVKPLMILLMMLLQACGSPAKPKPAEVVGLPVVQLPAVEPPVVDIPALPTNVVPVQLPAEISAHAADQVSAQDEAITGGDRFTYGQYERPFNSTTMDVYFPAIDIVDAVVYQDESWIYAVIQLSDRTADDADAARYGIELDTDLDGRGDWLVVAASPSTTDWVVKGVQIYSDENNDVGNVSPMFSDEGAAGDGFETLVFDEGTGADVESASVRVSPENSNVVEFAVKRSVLGSPFSFLVSMWAGHSLLDPALFDLNDSFTHEEAGAANPGFEVFYPIKAVSEIDNTCRLAVGFQPTGGEPGLCKTLTIQKSSDPAQPYSTTAPACEPCPEGAVGQHPYPDCACTFVIR